MMMVLLAHFVSGCQEGKISTLHIILDTISLSSHFYGRRGYGYLAHPVWRDEKAASRVAPLAAPG